MLTRKCTRCENSAMRRVNRAGFVERTLLPLLGLYPWECVFCRKKIYLRRESAGSRHSAQNSQA